LRLRGVATFPRADAGELAITAQRRLDLEHDLPVSHLAGVVTILSGTVARTCARPSGAAGPAAAPWMP
jgi:hypothetical protein